MVNNLWFGWAEDGVGFFVGYGVRRALLGSFFIFFVIELCIIQKKNVSLLIKM